jgi:Transposase and inactivated derivatives
MGQLGLKAKCKKRHYHSYKGEVGKIAPNILERDFTAESPNQKWTTDVTQVCINDKKLYFSPILDMFNGEIISYSISSNPNLQMVITMLRKHLSCITIRMVWYYTLIRDGNISTYSIRRCSKITE